MPERILVSAGRLHSQQQHDMRAGSYRFVFNKALPLQREPRERNEKHLEYVPMAKLLTGWRLETSWLTDVPVHPLQHALKDLERAYRNFFEGHALFSRFKRKGNNHESLRNPDPKPLVAENMSKSAGMTEVPGRDVHGKSGLNCSILDQGWSEFRTMLDYKLVWAGGRPIHTSQTCLASRFVSANNRRAQALFACVCRYENEADLVDAINVLERGHRLSASGDTSPGASPQALPKTTQAASA